MASKADLLEAIREALADYMLSEGCSCCRREDAHAKAAERLAQLLHVPRYPDGSGYDFGKFYSTPRTPKKRRAAHDA